MLLSRSHISYQAEVTAIQNFGHLCLGALMHQGINVQNDLLFTNVHCETIMCYGVFKLEGSLEKSYGFTFIGPVSMETLLTA